MRIRTKRLIRAGIVAGCITAVGSTCTPVFAEASSAELQEKSDDLQDELNGLNGQLDELVSEMDSLAQEAEDLNASMEKTEARLDEAQTKGEEQYEAMKLRIKYIYESGDSSLLELLCSAESMTDFLNKSDFVASVSEYDRKMLQELADTQEEISKEGDKLQEQHDELVEKQTALSEKRSQVESLISSTSSELSDYQTQLARAKEAEALAAQQKAEEEAAAKAAAEAAAQAAAAAKQQSAASNTSSSTSTVTKPVAQPEYTPGDSTGKKSLGSFKVTHYCPCFYCCGSWGGSSTASGTTPTPGRTIAVDPSVIPLGTRVIIDGQIYVAEDTGGSIKGNKIDIFVANHSTALALGTYYTTVYLAD